MISRPRLVLFLLAFALLSACSPVTGQGQPAATGYLALGSADTLGQTFFSRHRGLEGIGVYLAPSTGGAGILRLSLRAGAQSEVDLANASLPLTSVTSPAFYRFAIAPQVSSSSQDYYLLLQVEGTGTVLVGRASADTYLDGAAYLNGSPTDGQLTFGLDYEPIQMLMGLGGEALGWLAMLLAAAFLFVVPGWALVEVLLGPGNPLSWPEKLGLAAGTSLALYPVLLLWTDLLHLHLGPAYAWLPGSVGILVLVARRLRGLKSQTPGDRAGSGGRSVSIRPVDLAFLAVLGLIFLVRFYAIRGLTIPMWGDSVQHTMIAQLIVDNGGLFRSWQPYADLTSFTYHFGFHSAAAVVHWLTGLAVPQATLDTGQIVNGLDVLVLFPLATRATKNAWAGVGAVLVAGLLSVTPMDLTNWGRYTQLAGQAVLPAAVWVGLLAAEEKTPSLNTFLLGCILWAGLGLTHYRVLIFAALLWPAYFLLRLRRGTARRILGSFAVLTAGAGLLFLPWFVRMFSGGIISWSTSLLATPASEITEFIQQYNAVGNPLDYLPAWLWALAALGVFVGLWRRPAEAGLYALWSGFIFLAANPRWLGLPGDGLLSNSAVLLAAYIPVAVMAGCLPVWLWTAFVGRRSQEASDSKHALPAWLPRAEWALVLVAIALGGIGSASRVHDIVVEGHALVTRPDLRAMTWIQEHTPPDAKFLVNSFPAYGNSLIVGSDAGWWLPLLAGRQTNLPPVNYSSEAGPFPQYREWINFLSEEVETKGVGDPTVQQMLSERGIGYVYIGQLDGEVNSGGQNLPLGDLQASPLFCVLYHQERVWVFGFAASCAPSTPSSIPIGSGLAAGEGPQPSSAFLASPQAPRG